MKYCQNCGSGMDDAASFCANCGTKQVQQPAPVQAPPQPEPPAPKSFCPGCGAELKPDSAFCPNCGTRSTAPAAPAAAPSSGKFLNIDFKSIDWKALPNVVMGNVKRLDKKIQPFFLVSVCTLLLNALLVFFDMISVTATIELWGQSSSQSQSASFVPGAPAWNFIFFLLFVAGAAVTLFTLYTKDDKVDSRLVLGGAIVRALFLLILLFQMFRGAELLAGINEELGAYSSILGNMKDMIKVSVSFTVVGWLSILSAIAGLVGDYKCFTDMKKGPVFAAAPVQPTQPISYDSPAQF